ncbi:putative DNA topoisomerase 2-binding protein 1 [Hypsibius exemplaris]|uniref:DNA topoisomerase 2-binding protein 1 n=1 Tax=Hypsibius exemplaris TaxID=2072580 RepID=A0A1W0WDF4_HYPEX|nr:putative DNA topoisomerase 2-binding protein 1 [Hypsibius exemplaris]
MNGRSSQRKGNLMTINSSASQRKRSNGSQKSTQSRKVADIRFVQCDSQTLEERRALEEAFNYAKSKTHSDSVWVEGRDLETLSQGDDGRLHIFYVLHPFRGPAFESLNRRGCRIYSPFCMRLCLEKNWTLPTYTVYPIASVTLMSAQICCSNMEAPLRESLSVKVGSMGAQVTKALSVTNTHLITPSVGSDKYFAAARAGMKIVLPAWVDALLQQSDRGVDLSQDAALYQRFKVSIFSGCTICVSNIPMDMRRTLEAKFTSNGANYQKMLVREKTTHLICDEPTGEKFAAAKKWNVPVVTTRWVDECLAKGSFQPLVPFLLKETVPPPPPPPLRTPEHIKQGPNGDRGTSTPLRGGKKLDNTLDISVIPNMMPSTLIQPVPRVHIRVHPDDVVGAELHPPDYWQPDTVEPAKAENIPTVAVNKVPDAVPPVVTSEGKKVEPGVSVAEPPVASVSVPKDVVLAVVRSENAVAIRCADWAADVVRTGNDVGSDDNAFPLSDGISVAKKKPADATPSLAERILALKKPGVPAAALPTASVSTEGPSTSTARDPFDVLKLERKSKPAQRVRKSTRVSPKQQRALLCWSQAPRNPFEKGPDVENDGEDAEQSNDGEIPRPAVVASKPEAPPVGKAVTCGRRSPTATTAGPIAAAKKSVVGDGVNIRGKREASVVDVSDDSEPEIVDKQSKERVAINAKKVLAAPPKQVLAAPPSLPPVFMMSGIALESEKIRLSRAIKLLGATFLDSVQYAPEATHLIVKGPVKNEKYLACCAAGKWILHPSFLTDSADAGHFLPEESYEWGNIERASTVMGPLREADMNLAKAVHRWRKRVGETGQPAFAGWKVVLAADPKKVDGYIRLLEAGGATIITTSPPWQRHKDDATHFLHEMHKVAVTPEDLFQFAGAGCRSEKVEFISHYLMDEALMPVALTRALASSRGPESKRSKRGD